MCRVVLYSHRVPPFIIGFHKFSSGYAILAPGYKFRGRQFETTGYARTLGGRRGQITTCSLLESSVFTGLRKQSFIFCLFKY